MGFPQSAFQAVMQNSSSISLGTATQTLGVGSSATVTFSGAWPLARAVTIYKGTTNQTNVSSGVITKITWNTATFNTLGIFDDANDRITPTLAGRWLFAGNFYTIPAAATSLVQIRFRRNGSTAGADNRVSNNFVNQANANAFVNASCIFYMNGTTDYVEMYVLQDGGSDATIFSGEDVTWFAAHYLGA